MDRQLGHGLTAGAWTLGCIDFDLFSKFNLSCIIGKGVGSSNQNANYLFSLFSAFALRISYSCVNKAEKVISRARFFVLEIGQYGFLEIHYLMLISYLKEYLKKGVWKKI